MEEWFCRERERDDRISGGFSELECENGSPLKPGVENGFYRVSGREEEREKEWVFVFGGIFCVFLELVGCMYVYRS